MEQMFITGLKIGKVRHLRNIEIPLDKDKLKHLIITGKNGSGKTSLLEAMALYFDIVFQKANRENMEAGTVERMLAYKKALDNLYYDLDIRCNFTDEYIHEKFAKGEFILAYYKDEREFEATTPKHVEKVELKERYTLKERPRQDFIKFLLDLKMTQALSIANGKKEKAERIKNWFDKFDSLLQKIFENDSLKLVFDEDTFTFTIHEAGKESFDFNTLSSGYAAIMDIVVDLMIRMEKKNNKEFKFDMPGIVLIDEVETHLHLELQKNIMALLTGIFPNIQFVVTTHSPFVLNSMENVVIYDLENRVLVKNGLHDIPYEGIVEGFFRVDTMSELLKNKFNQYKTLVKKSKLSDEDFAEIAKLEVFLEEIPDYLALDITTEYKRLKLEFEARGDI